MTDAVAAALFATAEATRSFLMFANSAFSTPATGEPLPQVAMAFRSIYGVDDADGLYGHLAECAENLDAEEKRAEAIAASVQHRSKLTTPKRSDLARRLSDALFGKAIF